MWGNHNNVSFLFVNNPEKPSYGPWIIRIEKAKSKHTLCLDYIPYVSLDPLIWINDILSFVEID